MTPLGTATILQGDARALPLPDASVDAIVCDPPYGLEFMGKEWDSFKPSSARIRTRVDARTNPSVGKSITSRVDAYVAGLPFQRWCQAWALEAYRVLKPGGFLLSFGGTRTWHRLVCGVEDAGFEIRDSMAWLYGSGFPKSLDVAKAIDKTGGESPEVQGRVLREARERAGLTRDEVAAVVGCSAHSIQGWEDGRARAAGRAVEYLTPSEEFRGKLADLLGYTADERAIAGIDDDRRKDGTVYGFGHTGVSYGEPATAAARQWQGWGTALKPGFEPIVVARKPLAGTVAANVLAYGTGALNIDGCRVPGDEDGSRNRPPSRIGSSTTYAQDEWTRTTIGTRGDTTGVGRWPTNVVLSHSPLLDEHGEPTGDACADGCAPGCPVAELDQQSGTSTSSISRLPLGRRPRGMGEVGERRGDPSPNGMTYGDIGGASRFFPVFRYESKAPTAERPVVTLPLEPALRLRSDLTDDQRAYVLAELRKAGVDVS